MPIYDKNGIPIIGKEDDSNAKIKELTNSLVMAKGIVHDQQERLKFMANQNTNLVTILMKLMIITEKNRFRAPIKELDSIRADLVGGKKALKMYNDKAKNLVVYWEDVNVKEKEENEPG